MNKSYIPNFKKYIRNYYEEGGVYIGEENLIWMTLREEDPDIEQDRFWRLPVQEGWYKDCIYSDCLERFTKYIREDLNIKNELFIMVEI